jgi:ATP-binding cassette subfamily C protein LapB
MISSDFVEYAARLSGQAISRAYLDDIVREIGVESIPSGQAAAVFDRAWQQGKLKGKPKSLRAPSQLDCPFVAAHGQRGWVAVLARNANGSWVTQDAAGARGELADLNGCECISLPHRESGEDEAVTTSSLVWRAIKKHKTIYLEALLATLIINLLTLTTSLYSMQVYDRVIPNQGFQTLYVLSVGVLVMILLELLLKHVRSNALDKSATEIDYDLSEWFFRRSLGIRLERRPQMVGTLASQIRGYEYIRVVFSSTTLFVLAEVPFALFFIFVIMLIGGWVALVPLVLLPIALVTGLFFQRQIVRSTKENQGQSNRKAGLLVESLDAAETLKANSADWRLMGRWNRLVAEASESEDKVKYFSTMSQHVTVSLQQGGFVAIIALGAYLVTQNELTMGALIACSIISNRVLSPITQLPAVMIQVVQAKVAAEGLDALIKLPNEIDDQLHAMTPGRVDAGVRFEQVRFDYGNRELVALEIEKLDIKPGERVGVLGSIGSGKSTLTKLASGLYRPSAGRVFLGGLDMAQIASQVLRENIAYLPQDVRLISGTLRDNLLQGLPDPGDEAILETARKTGLIALIVSHPKGLFLPISEGGSGVSGGQRQLIGLTRMILAKPSVYILDEPTASMDSATEATVVAQLGEIAASGATMLIATHKTALLPLVDRLLVIHGGKLAIDGPRDAVIARLSGQSLPQTDV